MFITFEGPDGSGKTTIIVKLIKRLLSLKPYLPYVLTREPGGKDIKESEAIREIILNKTSDLSPISEALLYTTSRGIHVERVIIPALKENKLVICDRYIDSFYAYQGFARNLGLDLVKKMTEMVIQNTIPDITFYLDITLEQSEYRRNKQRLVSDRLDNENREFHRKVLEGYKYLIEQDKDRFIIIDAWQNIDIMLDEIFEKLMNNKKFKDWWDNIND